MKEDNHYQIKNLPFSTKVAMLKILYKIKYGWNNIQLAGNGWWVVNLLQPQGMPDNLACWNKT